MSGEQGAPVLIGSSGPRGQTGEQDQDMARMADLQVVLNMRIGNEIPSLLTLPNVLSCLRHIQV